MNLARVDLNLLVVFDAVLAERSATRAGQRLGLTQPAISNALARLRRLLGDELFVRGSEGMRPTPRALELAVPVRQALVQLQDALEPAAFIPAEARRTFNLSMTDYTASLILPPLAQRLAATAPGVDLRLRPNTNVNAAALLDGNEIDFAIGGFPDHPARFRSLTLFEDSYVCAMRRGHPLARAALTLEEFVAAKHLLVTLTAEATGIVDRVLEGRGLRRRVAMTINQFLLAPLIVGHSDLIITLARRTAEGCAAVYGLHLVAVPLELPPARVMLLWHERLSRHPAHEWLRATLVDICRRI